MTDPSRGLFSPETSIPGGCDDCLAEQTIEQRSPGVYLLLVHHDNTCPSYQRMVTNRAQRRAERRRP